MGKIKIAQIGIEDEEAKKEKRAEKRRQKKMREDSKGEIKKEEAREKEHVEKKEKKKKDNLERKVKKEAVQKAYVEEIKEEKKEDEKEEGIRGDVKEETKEKEEKEKEVKEEKKKIPQIKYRSKRYKQNLLVVDKKKSYPVGEAIELAIKTGTTKFEGSVEVHLNVIETGLKTTVTFPYFAGKKKKIVVCDDAVLKEIEKGIFDFDVLIATPAIMPKLARFAKELGPRGLMPNPKQGTVTSEPEKVIKELEGGKTNIKTEVKAPMIHVTIGKTKQDKKELIANFETLIAGVEKRKILKAIVNSTMGPGIKVDIKSESI